MEEVTFEQLFAFRWFLDCSQNWFQVKPVSA